MSVTIRSTRDSSVYLNIANDNFSTLWNSLGLPLESDDDWVGEVKPEVLKSALDKTPQELLIRERKVLEGQFTFINCGLTKDQVSYYYFTLYEVIKNAFQNKCMIVWY